jgi:hypothetical protein
MEHSPQAYRPKENHPWRRYRNKPVSDSQEPQQQKYSLRIFLSTLVAEWDTYSIPSKDSMLLNDCTSIRSMRDDKIAVWLVDVVKRYWINQT